MSSKDNIPPPVGPPPSYDEASSASRNNTPQINPEFLSPVPRNGIPPADRRSMEDENRPLPSGWIRQYDPETQHQFFVDTMTERSIWHHPLDDEQYLASLEPTEREEMGKLRRQVTLRDIASESSDEEEGEASAATPRRDVKVAVDVDNVPPPSGPPPSQSSTSQQRQQQQQQQPPQEEYPPKLPQRPSSPPPKGLHKLGRKLKDNITSTTHEEREATRRMREEEERAAYAAHQAFRRAMAKAMETGEPQFLGKDRNGKEIWVEPPLPPQPGYGYGRPGAYGARGYGYNPYQQGGPYYNTNQNVRYVRPNYPYQRPYGSGYGGGIGAPVLGGVLGGALLGGLLF